MKDSFEIARNNLKACFKDQGIVASVDHFSDFWARDSFYACWGLLSIGEYKKVRDNLSLFISYQKKNGHIPRRIDRFFVLLKYMGLKIRRRSLRPRYSGVYLYSALDPNILFIITFCKYVKESGDKKFLKDNLDPLLKAVEWLDDYEDKGLLKEGLFANWADIIVKKGVVLYTNVLYAEALKNLVYLADFSGDKKIKDYYKGKAEQVAHDLNNRFWSKDYYLDWIDKRKKYNYFSTDGNVLAMLFGLSDQKKNKRIIEYIEKKHLDNPPMRTNYPSYSWWRVKLVMWLVGTPGYQNNYASWLWLGCIYAVALHNNGYQQKAKKILERISFRIKEHNKVYELYFPNGVPYGGWYWKSASSFAWSSGLYLWMHEVLSSTSSKG